MKTRRRRKMSWGVKRGVHYHHSLAVLYTLELRKLSAFRLQAKDTSYKTIRAGKVKKEHEYENNSHVRGGDTVKLGIEFSSFIKEIQGRCFLGREREGMHGVHTAS